MKKGWESFPFPWAPSSPWIYDLCWRKTADDEQLKVQSFQGLQLREFANASSEDEHDGRISHKCDS
jgi:hypothetical protein